jgi:hypothetical protein
LLIKLQSHFEMETWLAMDFKLRLASLTQKGNPLLMGTPLGLLSMFRISDMPFIGTFDSNSFILTNNSILRSSCYLIVGSYVQSNSLQALINFKITLNPFYKYFVWVIFLSALVLVNGVFYFNSSPDHSGVIKLNLISFFLIILEWRAQKARLKRLRKGFIEQFELVGKG